MGATGRASCNACQLQELQCDSKKPSCKNCTRNGIKCAYPLTLKWGGRPYKDKSKRIKMPPNTKLVNGVLMANHTSMKVLKPKKLKTNAVVAGPSFQDLPVGAQLDIEEILGHSPILEESSALAVTTSITPPSPPMRMLKPMHMPGLDLLNQSQTHSEFFEYYVCETAHAFVPLNRDNKNNPFCTIVPQLALHSSTLMRIVMAFGGKHREQKLLMEQGQECFSLEEISSGGVSSDSGALARDLEQQSVLELIREMARSQNKLNDLVLASVLILASLSIFFGNGKNWHTHVFGAEGIIMQELQQRSKERQIYLKYPHERGSYFFLRRWFAYIRVMGCLSSGLFEHFPERKFSQLKIDFDLPTRNECTGDVDDVYYTNGMGVEVLSFLAQVANLILEKETDGRRELTGSTLQGAIELDYKIVHFLGIRKPVTKLDISQGAMLVQDSSENSFLMATNLLFGLSGLLQLRRRVIGLSYDNPLVRDLLFKMIALVENKLQSHRHPNPCLLFCIFSCGCELLEDVLVSKREICLAQIDMLIEAGVESASQAKNVMQECWRTSNSWWEVLSKHNLDICFAI
ncbi:LADA_0B08746g1_1 [Lachancea dasiensis]|uniref:LADA_0B08746g1_1 n=1 Tax=Lachancea dasiensis TaxID=1072105 RepID=A0A1G4IUQ0_9SACH|nr:LADA_0B08746g1_1 [Lachancea dasiensis]